MSSNTKREQEMLRATSDCRNSEALTSPALNESVVAIVVVIAWAGVASLWHDRSYDAVSVGISILQIGALVGALRWRAPGGWRAVRTIIVANFAFGFLLCGFPVISAPVREVTGTPISASAVCESALANGVWTFAFCLGLVVAAAIVPPRERERGALDAPRAPILIALSAGGVYVITSLFGGRFGWLGSIPILVFPQALIVPLLAAGIVEPGGRTNAAAYASFAAIHLFLSFQSTMLGWMATFVALTVLTFTAIGKWPSRRVFAGFVLLPAAVFLVLNPAKAVIRDRLSEDRTDARDVGTIMSYWVDAITSTWSDIPVGDDDARNEKTMQRLDYNAAGAIVFQSVPEIFSFEEGATYWDIPQMFVPRVIFPEKINNNDIRAKWTVKVGITTWEGSERSSFALPAPAEAYWNFGWVGVILVPMLLGIGCRFLLGLAPRGQIGGASYAVMVGFTTANFGDMLFNLLPAIPGVCLAAFLARGYVTAQRGLKLGNKGIGSVE